MKKFIIILLLFICNICYGQDIYLSDTCFANKYYSAYYSYSLKSPVYCIYKLYKGGGNVSRSGMSFTGNIPHFNYTHSGYDRGHLVPAEDFAYSKIAEKSTFKYYNCVPQTQRLNRGVWKTYETKIRNYSQKDSLLIIVGCSNLVDGVPSYCWKFAYSLTTKKLICSILVNQQGYIYDIKLDFEKRIKDILKKNGY